MGRGIWTPPFLAVTVANLTIVALVAFDGLAIVAALPSIAEDLGHVGLLPWVITAYLATSAVAIIIAGPVIDAVGVRRTFRVTGIWFLVSSGAAAVAPNMPMLIVARVVQGVGGGLVFAVVLGAVGLAYPHELRPRAFTANSMVWGVMGFGGPALAGTLLAFGSWRFIFVVQLPLTALALVMGWSSLPSTRERPEKVRTDWKGVLLISAMVGCSLLAVGQIGVRWWAAGVGTCGTALLAAAYWRHSGRAEEPVVSRDHLTRYPLRWVHVTSGLVLIVGLGTDNYIPLYVQTTRDRSVTFAAFSLVFLTIGWSVASVIYSRLLVKWREADVVLLGAAILLPSVLVSALAIVFTWPLAVLFGAFFFVGTAIGFVSTAGLTLMQVSSDPTEMGRVNAAHQFVRTLCITYGVALGGAILLLVIDLQVGDVDAVRDVLAGEDIALNSQTQDAIRDGLAWIHVVTGAIAVVCLAVALSLARRAKADDPAETRVTTN